MNGADIFVAALALVGGGAVGGALGGGAFGALDWVGGRLRAGIAGSALAGAMIGLVVAGGLPPPSVQALMARFQPPSMDAQTEQLLKTYYPQDYAEAQTTLRTLKATGASDAQIQQALYGVAMPLLQRQLPLASSENTAAYLDISKQEQVYLLGANPDLCYRMMMEPSAGTMADLRAALPPELKDREEHLALKLLQQTATAPQAPRPSADLDGELKIWIMDAYNGLSFEERDALKLGGPLRAKAYCDVLGNLLTQLTFMGPDQSTEAFKALTAQGMNRMNS